MCLDGSINEGFGVAAFPELLIVAVDFNLPHIDCEHGLVSRCGCSSSDGLIDMCLDFNMSQLVNITTGSVGNCESILDLLFASSEITSMKSSRALVDGVSDHRLVACDFHCEFVKKGTGSCKRLVYNFDNADDSGVLDEVYFSLSQFERLFSSYSNNVEEMWLFFKKLVFKSLIFFVRQKELKLRRHNP